MTEAQWLACVDTEKMRIFLHNKVTDRKQRLYACVCCHRIWDLLPDERSRSAVCVAEGHADTLESLRNNGVVDVTTVESPASGENAPNSPNGRNSESRPMLQRSSHYYATTLLASRADLAKARKAAYAAIMDQPFGAVGWAADAAFRAASARDMLHAGTSATRARHTEGDVHPALLRDIFGLLPFRPASVDPAWLTPTVDNLAAVTYLERSLPAGTLDLQNLAVLADALEDAGCTDPELLGHLRSPGPHVRGCWAVDLLLGKG